MILSSEIEEKMKVAQSVDEILSIAKEHGIKMTAKEASTYFEEYCSCALDDDLLENVAGGLVQLVNPSSSRL